MLPPRRLSPRPAWSSVLAVAALLSRTPTAAARAGGIATASCDGCHGSGASSPELTLTSDPATFNPGDSVTLTLTIRAPSIRVGGAFITAAGVGQLRALPGEGMAERSAGLAHTAPKPAVNGAVAFRFAWQAPSKPGGVDMTVAALAGNGNNASSGDAAGTADFQWAFGCAAQTFYADSDRDGYGSKQWGTRLGCVGDAAPEGYAMVDGDCDENNEKVHPGATEVCNKQDDNCDGRIDDNAPAVTMWPDRDGDGYYPSRTGTPQVGCGNLPGYAPSGGDCDDQDPQIHPGAAESCNSRDDDCDGEIDELVRPLCGTGWCSRYSSSCDAADCHPGAPAVEKCNHYDDDCDGEDDNGACPAGMSCAGSECVLSEGAHGSEPTPGGTPANNGSPPATPANNPRAEQSSSSCAAARGQSARGSSALALVAYLGLAALRNRRARRRASA